MGRKASFAREDMTTAALRVVAARGPHGLTIAEVAQEIGAPTGSIYHRYASREELLAELWMGVVEGFQSGFVEVLGRADDLEGALAAVGFMASWTRQNPLEARLLLLHRRQDFVSGDWPPELASRARALEPQLGAALRAFARRVFSRSGEEVLTRLRFALLDMPLGGIKPYVQAAKSIPRLVDELIATGARAVLATIPVAPNDGPEDR